MIRELYELVTGRPWIQVRSVAAEFGAPKAVRYAEELSRLSDGELLAYGDELVARLAEQEKARTASPVRAKTVRSAAVV